MKLWRVSAWSSLPHKKNSHKFSSCIVMADSRVMAKKYASARDVGYFYSDIKFWTAGAGHCMTAVKIKEIPNHVSIK